MLAPLLADPAFTGDDVAMLVADAATGRVLFGHDDADLVPPASTAKLAVAVAALQVLGPDARLTTRVAQGSSPNKVVLVGGGDPTLSGPAAVGPLSPGYPAPASLGILAEQTAAQLHVRGITAVSVGYDNSLFAGPTLAPGWKPVYQTEGDVAPVSALEVDQGHPDPGRTATAADPAAAAASEFAALLTSDGVTVTGTAAPTHVRSRGGFACQRFVAADVTTCAAHVGPQRQRPRRGTVAASRDRDRAPGHLRRWGRRGESRDREPRR